MAAAYILNGLPGTNPTAITSASAPLRVADMAETESFSTSRRLSSTALASIAAPFSIIAPRISTFDSTSLSGGLELKTSIVLHEAPQPPVRPNAVGFSLARTHFFAALLGSRTPPTTATPCVVRRSRIRRPV
jgi:hypothetical protein